MYIDYEREGLAKFMTHDGAAAPLVKDSGIPQVELREGS
jgi:hypothetical protein